MAWARSSILELVLVVLCLVLAFQAEGFFTVVNLLNVLRNVSMQGIIAFGMTMVIISGEIDLSVGSAVAFAGCVTAWLTQWLAALGLSMVMALPLAMVSTLLLGMSIGALDGPDPGPLRRPQLHHHPGLDDRADRSGPAHHRRLSR